ncbi:hypothetical protein LA080_004572 [Diaporthe eres]|uniref:Uncharacterized protein n=1 Tax=Diaporthe vaccinii TaxID=105482 RepID=A0ABR4ETA1_9PEZI|nr:hypothetical protein LA080_004572 [Diaporthe eres]
MADTIEHVSRHYPIPTNDYLRNQLEELQRTFEELQQFVGGGPECLCIDNEPPPPEGPADNGCDCNPCKCPTDRHPCYEGSEFNNGDRSSTGLRGALAKLQRRANRLLAELDAGGACECARRARAGKPIRSTKPPVSKRKPPVEVQTEDPSEDETEDPSGDETEDPSGDQTSSQMEDQTASLTEGPSGELTEDHTASLTEGPSGELTEDLTASMTASLTEDQTQDESSYLSTVTPVAPPRRKRPRDEREYEISSALEPFRDRFPSSDGLNFS